ncbi:MAG: hypothetical protein IIZ46_04535 [Clostridia bacterium]|nr:hypothetical protein [Clostridia bacterium]
MIKIKPYTELTNKDEFFNLYLYMVAKAVPFYPEDVFDDDYVFPSHIIQTEDDSYKISPRNRTKEYQQLLIGNNVISLGTKEKTNDEKQKNDALLAHNMIYNFQNYLDSLFSASSVNYTSFDIYSFLYKENGRELTGGHVNKGNLRTLLTTHMNKTALSELKLLINDDFFVNLKEDQKKDLKKKSKNLLYHVFRYEAFSQNKNISRLVEMLGVKVCPYCNRLFTTTVSKSGKTVRPQLDHYRDKSDYPFLALSIMNLVPSCGVCNLIKSNKKDEVLYPYEEEMGDNCTFHVKPKNGDLSLLIGVQPDNKDKIELKFKKGDENKERINNSIDIFKLEELYNTHTDIVSDLLLNRYICTDEMIDDILQNFPKLFQSRQEVKEILLMSKLDKERLGERPLGKLIHDISSQLDKEYAKIKLIGLLNKKE